MCIHAVRSVFAVCMKELWPLATPRVIRNNSDQTVWMHRAVLSLRRMRFSVYRFCCGSNFFYLSRSTTKPTDQPRQPPSLIRVFAVCSVDSQVWFLHADSEDSDQTGRMPRLIESLLWAQVILSALACSSSFLTNGKILFSFHLYPLKILRYSYIYIENVLKPFS